MPQPTEHVGGKGASPCSRPHVAARRCSGFCAQRGVLLAPSVVFRFTQGTEVWDPKTSSLLQVLVSIQGLILVEKPYYNEAGPVSSPLARPRLWVDRHCCWAAGAGWVRPTGGQRRGRAQLCSVQRAGVHRVPEVYGTDLGCTFALHLRNGMTRLTSAHPYRRFKLYGIRRSTAPSW